ncbi:MAG: amidohydrolase family protein, partial [Thermomicrobiales bacterium]
MTGSASTDDRGVEALTPIVDAHFHLWDLNTNYYPWLSDGSRPSLVANFENLRRNYRIGEFLNDVDSLPIVAGVHIQAEHDYSDPVRETRWLQEVADQPNSRGIPQGIIAHADLANSDVEAVLAEHCEHRNTRGIRQVLNRRLGDDVSYDPLKDECWQRNFPLLRKYNLSFDLQLSAVQAPAALRLIRANPEVQFILTHAGMPPNNGADGMEVWRQNIRDYARNSNV